jgi:hypothetical protein
MDQLASADKTCASCSGVCCTFASNSMQITPSEANALIDNLKKKKLLTSELREHCRLTISRFSLDRPLPGTGQRTLLRRRYTCPLFQHKSLGCPVDAESKPYGCLAFNPQVAGEIEGKSCRSDQKLLEDTEKLLAAKETDCSEKTSIPQAILAYFDLTDIRAHKQ